MAIDYSAYRPMSSQYFDPLTTNWNHLLNIPVGADVFKDGVFNNDDDPLVKSLLLKAQTLEILDKIKKEKLVSEEVELYKTYRETVNEVCDRISSELINPDEDMMFSPSDVISVSVQTSKGWRKHNLLAGSSMILTGCRVGARDALIFTFSCNDTTGENYLAECNLATAEKSIDNFGSFLMLGLVLGDSLSNLLKKNKESDKVVFLAKKAEKLTQSKNANPLFGSW